MRRIGIRELRDTLTATIRRVRAGESFEVTHDGVPVALLTPVPRDRVTRLVASGDVRPPRHSRRLHERYPTTTGVSASEALEEDRTGR